MQIDPITLTSKVQVSDRVQKPCEYCGEPMLVGVGKLHEAKKDRYGNQPMKDGKVIMVQAKNPDTKYHKHYRRAARRALVKINKKGLKNASQKTS